MNKELLEAIQKLQKKLEVGDQITIWNDEFQVSLNGMVSTNYSTESEEIDPNQREFNFEMSGLA
jgi:hypothetical protein|tara:strand:+ start:502 stop:693 length:192 start_codon:yes stop_codon:yes gene_type:complete